MPWPDIPLPAIAHAFLKTPKGRRSSTARVVRAFHRWMQDNGSELQTLQSLDIESFLQRPFRRMAARKVRRHYERELRRYLDWLYEQAHLPFDPQCLGPSPDGLPALAKQFLQAQPKTRAGVGAFHRWLKTTHKGLKQLDTSDLAPFLRRPTSKPVCEGTLAKYRRQALGYIDWLHEQGQLSFDPRDLAGRREHHPLPSLAADYVQTLEPVLKTSTIGSYRASLRKFHFWLRREAVCLDNLERHHIVAWLRWMHRRGLHPSTRTHALLNVRGYLRWLYEAGQLRIPADTLIRPGDLPKLPQYLPRPLEPENDRELQRRLRKKPSCPLRLGLLLMRCTGLRIGELIGLSRDCVRTDPKGNRFLKVPLGKLETERLVPLDDETAKLVAKLQRQGRSRRQLLFESAKHTKLPYYRFRRVLREACEGMSDPAPITSHRLRHTYATSLLAGGMSLVGVMRLLGHRDHRMTLRYAAITDETVTVEYHQALARNEQRYATVFRKKPGTNDPDPLKLLADLVRSIQKHAATSKGDPDVLRALVKRIRRLRRPLKALLRSDR